MAGLYFSKFVVLLVLCVVALLTPGYCSDEETKLYIVYLGNLVESDESPSSHHLNMLQEVAGNRQSLVRSYTRSFNGFAAYLTAQEHEKLATHEEVVSIFPSTNLHPQTTRSWDFMGLGTNAHRNPTTESDIIIGVIDTGIWPESESFKDKGFGLPPKKWKGVCQGGKNFTCNNKLIGARYYKSNAPTDDSARDNDGHGSHTAFIAAGNYVKDASFYGIAKGIARGGVPSARIAAYKVCHPMEGCSEADIIAAFDDAIADGVDIISISIGTLMPPQLTNDSISIGALHASLRGILVMQSAGNSGLMPSPLTASVAPWIFSVAASSTDRDIVTKVVLGDGAVFAGKSVNSFSLNRTSFPLIYGGAISSICGKENILDCAQGCLDPSLVKGKILLCNTYSGVVEASRVGAIGAVTLSTFLSDASLVVPAAESCLQEQDFHAVQKYFNSSKSPRVEILTSESVRNLNAPLVARFSSKGPNAIFPDILKPDVTAPGISILAAFSPMASPSDDNDDRRSVNYNILTGTSMACPHVSGAAAYVKSLHPNWSPSAIKSALMTTAWRMDATEDPLAEFSYGAGHIDPIKAVDPGLVYETSSEDYVQMLCGLGYDTAKIRKIFGINKSCLAGVQVAPKDLNYPSMSTDIMDTQGNISVTFSKKFTRTVTNVGLGNATYKVMASKSPGYNITVKPNVLTFGAVNEKRTFEVDISGKISNGKMVSASLEWSDGVHRVRSPIVVHACNDFSGC